MKILKVKNIFGRKTFYFMLEQFIDCYNDLKVFFDKDNFLKKIVTNEYFSQLENIRENRPKIDITTWVKADLAYVITFIGLTPSGIKAIKDIFKDKLKESDLDIILNLLSTKPHKDSTYHQSWKDSFDVFKHNTGAMYFANHFTREYLPFFVGKKFFKYYGGHQYKLSHYYRHLYQTVKYINEANILTYKEKYNYISFLRAQLSTPEQMLFAINAISSLGYQWEFKGVLDKDVNKSLVTKYNLIKNIVGLSINETLHLKSFFPDLTFQFEKYTRSRKLLDKKFK